MLISNDCPICGAPIPERPRGSRHGNPPKTCSEACRRKRASIRERERYARVKDSSAWKETRAAYLVKLKERLARDPEFAVIFRAEAAARKKEWAAKIRATDPARHEAIKSAKRAERAAWRRALESDPEAWEAHKAKCRAWYASLSEDERDRIFRKPRARNVIWTKKRIRMLGTMPDRKVAEAVGCSTSSVTAKRNNLGIPSWRGNAAQPQCIRSKADNELSRWRLRMGLSQKQAGKLLGIITASYNRLEMNFDTNRTRLVYRLACAAIEAGLAPIE